MSERRGYSFPIARKLISLAGKARANWLLRHQNHFNFWIHLLGIPIAIAGLPLLAFDWRWGLGALAFGYLLQWIGHQVEGNDVGEIIPIKKALGMRTVAIAPQYASSPKSLP